ncbi:MAG: protein-glutamate O-methyltransferase CheR [Spirochaetes bacterium]|nr:protein-glutamate O-methyltransferase CheR [Spirochaetota bacterium]
MSLIYELTEDQFEFLSEIVFRESRIKLSMNKKALLQSRVMRRMRILNLSNYNEYIDYLNSNYAKEIVEFINAVTTNKTEFFREGFHFDYLRDIVFPSLESSDEIRIWSAGCSTGEEPYSIAITACEYFEGRNNPVKILATDIDTNVLSTASEGIYKADQVAVMETELLKKYFLRGKNENKNLFKAKDSLKKMIHFARLNLLDEIYPMKKKFHVVFCRNVVIYFDKETQKILFQKFYNYITDSGYLFIGHSENITNFNLNFSNIGRTLYKKD